MTTMTMKKGTSVSCVTIFRRFRASSVFGDTFDNCKVQQIFVLVEKMKGKYLIEIIIDSLLLGG